MSATNPKIVFDVVAGAAGGGFEQPKSLDNKIYYIGYGTTVGSEFFVFDLSVAAGPNNPSLIADIRTGVSSSAIQDIEAHNGRIYFRADDGTNGKELYEYDPGLASGPTNPFLLDVNAGPSSSIPHSILSFAGNLFMGTYIAPEGELVTYDPSAAFDPGGTNPAPTDNTLYDDYISDLRGYSYSTSVTE